MTVLPCSHNKITTTSPPSLPHLVGVGELVIAATNQQVDGAVGEDVLGLQELPGVTLMEEIIDPVSVHSDSPGRGPGLGHLLGDPDVVVNVLQLLQRHLLVTEGSGQDTENRMMNPLISPARTPACYTSSVPQP